MMNHWLGVLNDAQFYYRQQAAEAEAAAISAAAPTMIGIGLVLKANVDDGLFSVEDVIEGGPADKSQKFQSGDFIVEVDGHDTFQQSFETVLGWIRGEQGTFVTMVLARVSDFEVMQRTATEDNPFGDAADIFSIDLRRDVVKKVDIYSHYSNSGSAPSPAASSSAPKQTPPLPPKPESSAVAALVSKRASVQAGVMPSFVFEGCLGKSKGTGMMGMIGYQDRYFTVDASHMTWWALLLLLLTVFIDLTTRIRYDEKEYSQKATLAAALGSVQISQIKGCALPSQCLILLYFFHYRMTRDQTDAYAEWNLFRAAAKGTRMIQCEVFLFFNPVLSENLELRSRVPTKVIFCGHPPKRT